MEPTDLTIVILREIREEIVQTRVEIVQTRTELSARIDETNARLGGRVDETNTRLDRLERRQANSEIRIATELVAVAEAVREVRDELRQDRVLRTRVDDHERRITTLESHRG
jgi:hypothetical protein